MFKLSDDDAYSTQLEGKKLKNRGARMDSHKLEIDKSGPALMQEVEVEQGQEFFIEREYGEEGVEEREDRLKKEMAAARRAQQELQKQQQPQQELAKTGQNRNNPNLKIDAIETGVMLSQNKGEPVIETQRNVQLNEGTGRGGIEPNTQEAGLRKTDLAATNAVLGPENTKNLDMADDKKLAQKSEQKSIPAQALPDVRGGNKDQGMGM